jgi:hypothetical protein
MFVCELKLGPPFAPFFKQLDQNSQAFELHTQLLLSIPRIIQGLSSY